MIYLIKSAAYTKERGHFFLLKIGYTDSFESRFNLYKTHNPTFEIIKTIEEGTVIHEFALHSKFKEYQYSTEWFECSQEIIDFFENLTRISLDQMISGAEYSFKKTSKLLKESIKNCLPKDLQFLANRYSRDGKLSEDDNFKRFYCTNRLWERGVDYKIFKMMVPYIGNELLYEYLALGGNISRRIKFLCEIDDNDSRAALLQQLNNDDYAKSYYLQLGPDRCKALGYNVSNIRKELKIITFDKSELDREIYNKFNENMIIKKSDAKNYLKDIYRKVDFNASPKATDLEEWFETKTTSIREGNRVVSGIKLLKRLK